VQFSVCPEDGGTRLPILFVSTKLNGVASRETSGLTLSDAGPIYQNNTGFGTT
jgi:hypothetical protein